MSNNVVVNGKDIDVAELKSFWDLFADCVGPENLPDDWDEVIDDLDYITFEVHKDYLKIERKDFDSEKEEYEATFEECLDIILAACAAE